MKFNEIIKFRSDLHENLSPERFSPQDLDFSGPEGPKKKKKKKNHQFWGFVGLKAALLLGFMGLKLPAMDLICLLLSC